jgi:hypothetical protein
MTEPAVETPTHFIDETNDPFPEADMNYDAATGELGFMPAADAPEQDITEAIAAEPEPTPTPAPTADGVDWEARFKGLQASATSKFQELADIKKRLEAAEARSTQAETATQSTTAYNEMKDSLRSLWQSAQEDLDGDGMVDFVSTAVERLSNHIVEQRMGDIPKTLSALQQNQQSQAEAMRIVSSYGPERLKVLSPWVTRAMQQNPQAFERYTLPQVYEYVDGLERKGVLGANPIQPSQPEQPSRPSSEEAANVRDFAKEAQQMQTEQSYAPSGANVPVTAPIGTFDAAIDAAFADLANS